MEESEYLGKMPASLGMIAAGLGNLDTSDGFGKVFYRQDTTPQTLQKASDYIARAYPEDDEVDPTNTIVVTWENVASQDTLRRGDMLDIKVSTFKLSLWQSSTLAFNKC